MGSIFFTLNVFVPFAKRSNSSLQTILASYVLGWLVGDLLPHWILFNLGILLIFSFSDILFSQLGWGGIVCHILCWCFLSIRLWIVMDLPERLNKKMTEAVGIQWQKFPSVFLPPKNIFQVDWNSWFNPNKAIEDPRIEILRDLVFFEKDDFQLKLDIYRPKNIKIKHPGILQIHGGAWITGSRRQASYFLTRMAIQGWVCYSVTHRFSPDVLFPEHLIDIKRALSWIRNTAGKHGLDKNFIICKGVSSGGHLASMMALTQNNSEFQPGFEDADTSIQGCVPVNAVFDFSTPFNKESPFPAKLKILKKVCGGSPKTNPNCYKKITPSNWIKNNITPFLIIQGETDALISIKETEKFWNDFKNQNVPPSALLSLPLVEHAFDIFPTLTAQCIVPIIDQYMIMLYQKYISQNGGK